MQIKLSDHFTYGRLLRFALPTIGMMVFTSVYGMIDGLFVSNYVGKDAFAAVNLIMPLLMALGCFGYMFGTGGAALVAKTLGEGDQERADRLFSMISLFAAIVGMLLAGVGYLAMEPFLLMFGASGDLLEEALLYGRILLIALPFFIVQNTFQSFFIAAEKPHVGFAVTLAGGLANIVLDFVFIVLAGWGVAGAAIATLLGQVIAAVSPLAYFKISDSTRIRLARPIIDFRAFGKACVNGSSELATEVAASIVAALYNMQLMKLAGADGVAAYGVIMYVSFIFMAIFFGFAMGIGPVISFHYGARNHGEMHGLLKKSLVMVAIGGIAMFVLSQSTAVPLVQVFVGYDAHLMELTLNGFRIYSCAFLLSGFSIFGSAFFTALNNGLVSAFISFMRTLVFETTTVIFLPMVWGIDGVWCAIIVAEGLALFLTAGFMFGLRKRYGY